MNFIVTTRAKSGATRTQVWNPALPLALGHPFQWIIEKTTDGIRLRDVASKPGVLSKVGVKELTTSQIQKGAQVELPLFKLSIKPSFEIDPVFADKKIESAPEGRAQVYHCIGNWVLSSTPLETEYTGYSYGKPVFSLKKSGFNFKINFSDETAKLQGVRGEKDGLSADELARAAVALGNQAWRFGFTQTPQLKATSESRSLETDQASFRYALRITAVAFAAFMLLTFVWPKTKPSEEIIPPQFAKIVMPARSKAEQAESQAGASPAQQSVKKAEKSEVVQAFRAKALQNAVSGLLKGGMTSLLAQSDFVAGSKNSANARKIFDKKSDSLATAVGNVGPTDAKNTQVASLGGNGGGGAAGNVGYGKGDKAGVTGQGKGQIALDTLGGEVEEGLTKDEVGEVIHRHLSEVRYCYEAAMLRTPDVEGKLILNFTIGGSGVVKTAGVKQSTLPDPRLDDCILRRLLTWKFPNTKGGIDVAVSYPFIFKTLGR